MSYYVAPAPRPRRPEKLAVPGCCSLDPDAPLVAYKLPAPPRRGLRAIGVDVLELGAVEAGTLEAALAAAQSVIDARAEKFVGEPRDVLVLVREEDGHSLSLIDRHAVARFFIAEALPWLAYVVAERLNAHGLNHRFALVVDGSLVILRSAPLPLGQRRVWRPKHESAAERRARRTEEAREARAWFEFCRHGVVLKNWPETWKWPASTAPAGVVRA